MLLKPFHLILIVALLTACSPSDDARTITLTLVKDEAALRAQCGNDLIVEPLGCAKVHGRACTIVAFEPRGFDDHRRLETLGHELWHCVRGPKHV